jgi:hypothetical protein
MFIFYLITYRKFRQNIDYDGDEVHVFPVSRGGTVPASTSGASGSGGGGPQHQQHVSPFNTPLFLSLHPPILSSINNVHITDYSVKTRALALEAAMDIEATRHQRYRYLRHLPVPRTLHLSTLRIVGAMGIHKTRPRRTRTRSSPPLVQALDSESIVMKRCVKIGSWAENFVYFLVCYIIAFRQASTFPKRTRPESNPDSLVADLASGLLSHCIILAMLCRLRHRARLVRLVPMSHQSEMVSSLYLPTSWPVY